MTMMMTLPPSSDGLNYPTFDDRWTLHKGRRIQLMTMTLRTSADSSRPLVQAQAACHEIPQPP